MKAGLATPNGGPGVSPERALALARRAESLGYDSLWVAEHVVVPGGYESVYPYSRSGRMPGGEDVAVADPLVWLAFVAAHCATIRLCTGILILPQRNPLILAKEAATLDVLSGGRAVLGVGVGWLREEFDALGVPFDGRGARTEEYIAAMRTLWREDDPSFAGETVSFEHAKSYPKPVRGSIPVVIGGHSEAAARRAGRVADGFYPFTRNPDRDAQLFEVVRAAATEAGRDPGAIELTAASNPDLDMIRRYADLGVHRVTTPPLGADLAAVERALGHFAELVSRAT